MRGDAGSILIYFPHNPELIAKVKTIRGEVSNDEICCKWGIRTIQPELG